MAHEAETQSPAITPASAASSRRKRLILLCCEDLRPIACSLEGALRSRGWEVDLELGAAAKPWIQQIPPVRPSLRVLCVPGTVDPTLARQLRAAFRPDPEADLHILGVDDSRGLVHEIERLAGAQPPPRRRSLYASPRLTQPTLVETQVRTERRWLMGATAALAAFAITLGGMAMVEHSTRTPAPTVRTAASLASMITAPADLDDDVIDVREGARFDEPTLAAVTPVRATDWDWDVQPPEEEDEVLILDDELDMPDVPSRSERTPIRSVDVTAPPLAEPSTTVELTAPETAAEPIAVAEPFTTPEPRHLPRGFLPVAGLTPPPRITVDPFTADEPASASTPLATVDPFAPAQPAGLQPEALATPNPVMSE